ncbi:unnamed protein product [Boreogadus saida]
MDYVWMTRPVQIWQPVQIWHDSAVERLSSHPALSRNSQGLPGAGLISVLKAEPGPGPDRYNQKIYGNVRLHCICSTTHHTN